MEERSKQNPREDANVLSVLLYWWLLPLCKKAYKEKELDTEDIYDVLQDHSCEVLGDRLEREWTSELLRAMDEGRKPRLFNAFWKCFGPSFMLLVVIRVLTDGCLIGQAVLVQKLVEGMEYPWMVKAKHQIYVLGIGICCCSALHVFLHQGWTTSAVSLGMKMAVAGNSVLYRKCLKLRKETQMEQRLTGIMEDLLLFDKTVMQMVYVLVGPLEAAVVTYVLWSFLEASSLAGMAFLLFLIPLQIAASRKISQLEQKTAESAQERVRVTKEVLTGIIQIKQWAWEEIFHNKLKKSLRLEMRAVRISTLLNVLMSIFHSQGSRIMTILTITTFVLLGNSFVTSNAFLTICALQTLRIPLCVGLPLGTSLIKKLLTTINKLQEILMFSEWNDVELELQPRHQESPIYSRLILMDVTATWDNNCSTPIPQINRINMGVQQGELLVVVGPSNSGKSSLLQILLGELAPCSGIVNVNGKISYCPQDSWIFPATVRSNITLGAEHNKFKYRQVIQTCCLDSDINLLPLGDLTTIGEDDQLIRSSFKAKITLARAIYREADIYLLDQPFYHLDRNTVKLVFNRCIRDFLKYKTQLLVTSRLQLLEAYNHVMVMKNGEMEACGTYEDLLENGIDFEDAYHEGTLHRKGEEDGETNMSESEEEAIKACYDYCRKASRPAKLKQTSASSDHQGPRITSTKALFDFVKGCGKFIAATVLVPFIIAQTLTCTWDYCFMVWTYYVDYERTPNISMNGTVSNLVISATGGQSEGFILWMLLLVIFLIFLGGYVYLVSACLISSRRMHNSLLCTILKSSVNALDASTSEKILSVSKQHMKVMQEILPATLLGATQYVFMILGCLLLIVISNYWNILATVVLLAFSCTIGYFCLPTTRALKRLEILTRSPVSAHLKSTLQGIISIRALEGQAFFQEQFEHHQNLHTSAWFLFASATHGLGLWLGLLSVLYTICVIFGFLLLGDDSAPGDVGLATYCCIFLSDIVPSTVGHFADLSTHLTSVISSLELQHVQQEMDIVTETRKDVTLAARWPLKGEIQFEKVSLQYYKDDPWILQNLSFQVKPGEKVGIVGRVGAGKSSLVVALFRMFEPCGLIKIDGVDIKDLPVSALRSRLSIVPRYPVLFSGMLRDNLDPNSEYSDAALWDALEKSDLRAVVQSLPSGLQTESLDWNKYFNHHQKQLFCLAKAILLNNTILVVDVASENQDPMSEEAMQRIVNRYLPQKTVLTVSHRLSSIMSSERVLVIENGRMAEFGHPYLLLQNEYSHFYKLVHETGAGVKERLVQIAKEAYIGSSQSSLMEDMSNKVFVH